MEVQRFKIVSIFLLSYPSLPNQKYYMWTTCINLSIYFKVGHVYLVVGNSVNRTHQNFEITKFSTITEN